MPLTGRIIGTKKKGINIPKVKLPPNIQVQFGALPSAPSAPKVGTVTPGTSGITGAAKPLPQAATQAPKPVIPAPGNPSPVDPRDAEYYNLLAQNEFTRNQGISSITRQKGESQSAFDTLLQRLSTQETDTNQTTKQNANKEGLFYSGILGKRLQDVATGYENQRTDARTNLSSVLAGFGEQERGLYGQYGTGANGDYGLQGAGLLNAATGRQGERDRIAAEIVAQQTAAAELARLLAPAPTTTNTNVPTSTGGGSNAAQERARAEAAAAKARAAAAQAEAAAKAKAKVKKK